MAFIADEVKADDYRVQALNRVLKIEDEVIRNMAVPEHFHMNGWVYVLSNEAMPGIYKIGMTTTTPEVRAREISQGTGVPLPYKVEYAFYSQNPREDEAEIHEMLSDYRVNQNREFFRCDIEYILDACSGQMLFSREDSVELIADRCNVITFDKTSKLNLAELFEDIGISAFGDLNAVAEGLIRMSARVIRARDFDGISVLFSNGKAQRIMQEITQNYEAYLADHPEKDSDEKACNSPL